MAENAGGVEYNVEADTKQAVDNMHNVVDEVESMISAMEEADSRTKRFEKNIKSMGNTINDAGQVVDKYGNVNTKLTQTLKTLKDEMVRTRTQGVDKLNQSYDKAPGKLNAVTRAFKIQKGAMQQIGFQLQDISVQAAQGVNGFTILGQQGSQLAGILGPAGVLVGALIAVGALMGTALSGGSDEAQESIDELIEKIDELGDKERELLKIRIESEITQAYSAMGEANIQVRVLSGSLEEAKKRSKDLATESNLLKTVLNATFGESEKENVKELSKEILEQQATVEKLRRRIEELTQSKAELVDADRKSAEATREAKDAYESLSESFAGQIALVGKNEREQAKIAAAIKLGTGATIEQTDSINALIDSYFDLKEAAERVAKEQAAQQREVKKTATAILNLSNQLEVAKKSYEGTEREAFQLAAVQKLGTNATKAQVDETKRLSGELYDLVQAQNAAKKAEQERNQAISALGQADPAIGVGFEQGSALANLESAYEAGLIAEQTYNDRKVEINRNAEMQIQEIAEQRFRAQSDANEFLIGTLDSLAATATSTFSSFLVGASSAKEVVQSLAQTVLQEAVGALIQLGLQALKNQIIGQTAQTVAATTAAATGASIAAAYAPAAAFASLASFGGNAAPAAAGITSTVALSESLAVAGGLETGGTLTRRNAFTPVGEGNAPEILSTDSGNFMIPGSKGKVYNQEQLSQIDGGGSNVQVIINNNAPGVDVTAQSSDDGRTIEIAVAQVEKNFQQSMRQKSGVYFESLTQNTTANSRSV